MSDDLEPNQANKMRKIDGDVTSDSSPCRQITVKPKAITAWIPIDPELIPAALRLEVDGKIYQIQLTANHQPMVLEVGKIGSFSVINTTPSLDFLDAAAKLRKRKRPDTEILRVDMPQESHQREGRLYAYNADGVQTHEWEIVFEEDKVQLSMHTYTAKVLFWVMAATGQGDALAATGVTYLPDLQELAQPQNRYDNEKKDRLSVMIYEIATEGLQLYKQIECEGEIPLMESSPYATFKWLQALLDLVDFFLKGFDKAAISGEYQRLLSSLHTAVQELFDHWHSTKVELAEVKSTLNHRWRLFKDSIEHLPDEVGGFLEAIISRDKQEVQPYLRRADFEALEEKLVVKEQEVAQLEAAAAETAAAAAKAEEERLAAEPK